MTDGNSGPVEPLSRSSSGSWGAGLSGKVEQGRARQSRRFLAPTLRVKSRYTGPILSLEFSAASKKADWGSLPG